MTIDQAVRNKVIQMYLVEHLGRNEIFEQLKIANIKISSGSVSNILKQFRENQPTPEGPTNSLDNSLLQKQSSFQEPPTLQKQASSSPKTNQEKKWRESERMPNVREGAYKHSENQGKSLQKPINEEQPALNESDVRVTTFREVEFKKNPDISIENHVIKNFEKDGYPVEGQKGGPLGWFTNGYDSQPQSSVLTDSPTVNPGPDRSLPQSPTFVKTVARPQQQKANVEAPEDLSLEPVPNRAIPRTRPKFTEDKFERELSIEGRRAWDYYGAAQTKILTQIQREKDQRRHQMLLLERRKKILENKDKQINHNLEQLDQKTKELDSRETRILEAEPFLAVAKKLQEMKLTLEDALPWIEAINEVAQMQNLNLREAALYVTQELRLYREFGGLDNCKKQLEGEIKMLNISITQKQPIITTLLKLHQNGVKDDDIIGLSKIIDLSKMSREWTPFRPRTGLEQGNNASNNPGSSNTNILSTQQPNGSNGNDNYGGNFSIWLNLLNRMGSSS